MNYRDQTNLINKRYNPENIQESISFAEKLTEQSYRDVERFIKSAMNAVPAEYTAISKRAGERVKSHLESLNNCEFEYQGSVMTDTHIKGYSDIDLLVLCSDYYLYDKETVRILLNDPNSISLGQTNLGLLRQEYNATPYSGLPLLDLSQLRSNCELILTNIYNQCDISQPKSIKIRNLNLNRDVDVVIANKYKDVIAIVFKEKIYTGIQVFNKATLSRENPDYPFLSINSINDLSVRTNGRLKKMIRFLKNIKANSTYDYSLSSFDINAICYDIDSKKYSDIHYLSLVGILYEQLSTISNNDSKANSLTSVDGKEKILMGNQMKKLEVKLLALEVESILQDLNSQE